MTNPDNKESQTHFGYEQVATHTKAGKVANVFHSVAESYDVMNDLMSLGIHRIWKRIVVEFVRPRAGQKILDLAGGTGDLSLQIAPRVGDRGQVILSDINASMLKLGRDRMIDHGLLNNIDCVQINAESLPFPNNYFDCITIAFGLRNVTDKAKALAAMYRVLKPGGKLLVLEFSKPVLPGLKSVYDFYSFKLLPKIGKLVANDEDSYRYLAESIRMHPGQQELKKMLEIAGYSRCDYINMSGGIVALHRGYKF